MEMIMKKGEMLSNAILIATNGHAGQFDKGGMPYILHPLTVMHKLKTDDEELQCAAVLHDYIEDVKIATYEYLIEKGMSSRVIRIVKALTKVPGETLDEYKARVFDDVDAMAIKKEDLRTNSDLRRLKGVTEKDLARNAKYQLFYYQIDQILSGNQTVEQILNKA
jgi:GTP diphosphokinase / guanosine-3',5'-bis(diphosphate) 3'-diphosphatase